jgi:hypothetical protein
MQVGSTPAGRAFSRLQKVGLLPRRRTQCAQDLAQLRRLWILLPVP